MKIQSKPAKRLDISDVVPYSEQHDRDRMPPPNTFLIERHVPGMFATPFHHHTSVEINFLENCDMTYEFSGRSVEVQRERLTVFWGAQPHRVTRVSGRGRITNIYLSLGQVLRWGLPDTLVKALLSGAVLGPGSCSHRDVEFFDRLWNERGRTDAPWRRTHLDEIANRLRRFGLEGPSTLLTPAEAGAIIAADANTMRHVEEIMRCVAEDFSRAITVGEIAAKVNLSSSRATALFREIMGTTIKEHLTRTRLSHARMLLTETDAKIVTVAMDSGFRTLSSFYAAFSDATGISPAQYRKDARGA